MFINNRLLSIKNFIPETLAVVKRFPFVCFYCLTIIVVGLIAIEYDSHDKTYIFINIIRVAFLGIPLSFILKIISEKNNWSTIQYYLFNFIVMILLFGYYFTFPATHIFNEVHEIRYGLLCLISFGLITFLPFRGKDEENGFWAYNKALVFNYIFAHISSFVLTGGVLLAIVALNKLFNLDIDEKRYGETGLVIVGILLPMLFLSNIPQRFESYREDNDYPKIIKIFAQYILAPLMALYFVILFAYEIKIVAQWNWPNGWVSWLVTWYAVVGLATMVLLYPLREQAENRWFKKWFSGFTFSLIPFIIMLFFAISTRISEYGITENRYFVYAFAVSLSIITLYLLISKTKNIRIIPTVVVIIAILASYGPQSAFSISQNSQKGKLEELLLANDMFVDNKAVPATKDISFEDRQSISSKITYLVKTHGFETIRDWFSDFDLTKVDTMTKYTQYTELTKLLGFTYINQWQKETSDYVSLYKRDQAIVNISGYDQFILLNNDDLGDRIFSIGPKSYEIRVNYDSTRIEINERLDNLIDTTLYSIWLNDTLSTLKELFHSPQSPSRKFEGLAFEDSLKEFDFKILINSFSGRMEEDTLKLNNLNGYLLIREK